jgi:hypothetical protein
MVEGNDIMIAIDKLTDSEFDTVALEILGRELGPDGLARFLRLNRSGSGDYTAERSEWPQALSVDEIAQSIWGRRVKAV